MSTTEPSETNRDELELRQPELADGLAVTRLLRSCPGLDRNSHYAQLLLCWHFAETCVLATDQSGTAVGFVSAYRLPANPETVFIWQIAVAEAGRGQGLAGRLLDEIFQREATRGVRYLEATVTPSNTASRRLFQSWARRHDAPCSITPALGEELFDEAEPHESEDLFRIGPLDFQ